MPTMLDVTGLGHTYPGANGHTAVADLSFRVEAGELTCIVGPSGCGKSTLLRAIAHLLEPSTGEVRLHGDLVTSVPEDLAVVFQDYGRSLFPWMTVRGNVEFPLRARGLGRTERRDRATETLRSVGLRAAGSKYPWQLSGGMQQRVAIARALACRPALLLMDEPFASVDAQTRFELEDLLLRVRREQDTTVLLVTHDIDESVYLGDRILVLSTSPASIVTDLPVDLGPERDQISTRESETFVHLRGEVARQLRTPERAADVEVEEEAPRRRWWHWGRRAATTPAQETPEAPVPAPTAHDAGDTAATPGPAPDTEPQQTEAASTAPEQAPLDAEPHSAAPGPERSESNTADAPPDPEPAGTDQEHAAPDGAEVAESDAVEANDSEDAAASTESDVPVGESKRMLRRRQANQAREAAEARSPAPEPAEAATPVHTKSARKRKSRR